MIYNSKYGRTFREAAFMVNVEVIQSYLIVHDFDLRQAAEYSRNMPHKRPTGTIANEICSAAGMNYEPPNATMITQSSFLTLFLR